MTQKDKLKELTEFFVSGPQIDLVVTKDTKFEPVGVSVVVNFKYSSNDLQVCYKKWYVESFELANKMGLLGCEHHNKLVKGSGVFVLSRKLGANTFYDKDAQDIINACELNHDIKTALTLAFNHQNQK
nr:hypothetical protein [Candidatus Enterousia merdequi]